MKARERGFTLMELVTALVIASLLGGIIAPLIATAVSAMTLQTHQASLEEAAQYSLSRMAREIRRLRNAQSVSAAAADVFEFIDTENIQIRYGVSSGSLVRREGSGGTDYGMAENLQAGGLQFVYYDQDGNVLAAPVSGLGNTTDIKKIEITLTLQNGGQTHSIQTQIRPRNVRDKTDLFP